MVEAAPLPDLISIYGRAARAPPDQARAPARDGSGDQGGSSNNSAPRRRGKRDAGGGMASELRFLDHDTLNVAVLNIDGARVDLAPRVAELMKLYRLDVLILVETKWYGQTREEFAAALAAAGGAGPERLHLIGSRCRSGRGREGPRAGGKGGVAAAVRGDLDVTLWSPALSEEARAEVAAASAAGADGGDVGQEDVLYLQVRLRGNLRFTRIIGVYLSPSLPQQQVRCRLRRVCQAVMEATAAGETVVVCGDLNARMGGGTAYLGAGDYRTVDTGVTPHTAAVCDFMDTAGLQPVHGMLQGQRLAKFTNHPAAGASVVDYILVPSATAVDVVVGASQTPAGAFSSAVSSLATSHAMLMVQIRGAAAAAEPTAGQGRGLSNKLTARALPAADDSSGKRDEYDAVMCRVMAAGAQHASALSVSVEQWVGEDPTRNTPAVRAVAVQLLDEVFTRPVVRHTTTTWGLNPHLHPAVVQCALADVPRPEDSLARELYDRLRAIPVPRWQDVPVPAPVPPQPAPAMGAAAPVAEPDVAIPAAAGGAVPVPAVAQPRPTVAARVAELALAEQQLRVAQRAAELARGRAAAAAVRVAGGVAGAALPLSAVAEAESAEKRAAAVRKKAGKLLKWAVRRERVVGITHGESGPRSRKLWQRVKAAAVGLRPDGTFDAAEASGRTTGIPNYFSTADGNVEPALHAFEREARKLYGTVGHGGISASEVPTVYRGRVAPAPISCTVWTAAEVRRVMEGDGGWDELLEGEGDGDADGDDGDAEAAPRAALGGDVPPPAPCLRPTTLRKNKSPGMGGVTREHLSCDGDATTAAADREARRDMVYASLAQFLSLFLTEAVDALPGAWQMACINPILKAGEPPTSADASRLITVQPVWGKLWELLRLGRAAEWAETHRMLSDTQFGFRQGRGVEDAVFCLLQGLHVQHHIARKRAYVAFVDLRKAYDMVPRDLLLAKLEAMGVGAGFLRQQRMSFAGASARVWLNGEVSAPFPMLRGVPQGDPLSPLLFSLFLDDLLQELASSTEYKGLRFGSGGTATRAAEHAGALKELAYADDVALPSDDPDDLQRGLDIVGRWAGRWGMVVNTNVGKTEVMVFPSPDDRRRGQQAAAAGVVAGESPATVALKLAEAKLLRAQQALERAEEEHGEAGRNVSHYASLLEEATRQRVAATASMVVAPVDHNDEYVDDLDPLWGPGPSPEQWDAAIFRLEREEVGRLALKNVVTYCDDRAAAVAGAQRSVADAEAATMLARFTLQDEAAEEAAGAGAAAQAAAHLQLLFTISGKPVGLTASYTYLGVLMTPDLNVAAAIQARLKTAKWHAGRWRQLPHGAGGLPIQLLSSTYTALVQTHLEYAMGVLVLPRAEGQHFAAYRCAAGTPAAASAACADAAKLQASAARHVLALDDPQRWAGRPGISTATVLAELGWTPLASRWEMALLRVLGNVLRSPQGSVMRSIALQLRSHACNNSADPQPWNWWRTAMAVVASLDGEARPPAAAGAEAVPLLSDHFEGNLLLPRQVTGAGPAAPAALSRPDAAEWADEWKSVCYAAINGGNGRDARVWRAALSADAGRYAPTVRTASAPVAGTSLAAVAGRPGPAACGSTSVMASRMALAPSWKQRFGKRATAPFLLSSHSWDALLARVALRVGVACTSKSLLRMETAGVQGAPPGEGEGGCLWGRAACQLCEGGHTADAYHLLAECPYPALEQLRLQAFTAAATRLRLWQKEEAARDAAAGEHVAQALAALEEARLHLHTLPGQSLVYLAALGMPVASGGVQAAADAAGLPQSWIPLLEMPQGTGRWRQRQTVAARVLSAFAPLAVHVAALRNGKGSLVVAAEQVVVAAPAAAVEAAPLALDGGLGEPSALGPAIAL